MRSQRTLGTGVATVTLALLLAACNGSDSSSDGRSPASATSVKPSKTAPKSPGKTSAPTASASSSSNDDADPNHIGTNVCDKLSTRRVGELIGRPVTSSDFNDLTGKHEPNLCMYTLDNGQNIGIGVEGNAHSEWVKMRRIKGAKFTHEFGDETADFGNNNYAIRKDDTTIVSQGTVSSGLAKLVIREAVKVL